jgi:hypothetical protein
MGESWIGVISVTKPKGKPVELRRVAMKVVPAGRGRNEIATDFWFTGSFGSGMIKGCEELKGRMNKEKGSSVTLGAEWRKRVSGAHCSIEEKEKVKEKVDSNAKVSTRRSKTESISSEKKK